MTTSKNESLLGELPDLQKGLAVVKVPPHVGSVKYEAQHVVLTFRKSLFTRGFSTPPKDPRIFGLWNFNKRAGGGDGDRERPVWSDSKVGFTNVREQAGYRVEKWETGDLHQKIHSGRRAR